MPKIIENVRGKLLEETQKQIVEHGYAATTVRSVASACGLGVGTVYNYFPSKDMLIANFMLEDWQVCLSEMREGSEEGVLFRIYSALKRYMERHQALFRDKDALKAFTAVFMERHKQLRESISEVLLPICEKSSVEDKKFLAEFIAESLLTWTVADKSFEEISSILIKLIK